MPRISLSTTSAVVGLALLISCPLVASAQVYFTDEATFQSAAGGGNALTLFTFDSATETDGKLATDPTITPSYSSQGVDFLPFAGSSALPSIARGQDFQIAKPGRDGLLINANATAPASNIDARAIRFQFNRPERAVGLHFNGPLSGGDGGFIRAFDINNSLIGQTPTSAAGGFVGLISPTSIVRVDIVNTFNSDITFGIYDLQFGNLPVVVPEASTFVLALPALIVGANVIKRRKK